MRASVLELLVYAVLLLWTRKIILSRVRLRLPEPTENDNLSGYYIWLSVEFCPLSL
jgi:hypothetical protein